MAFTYQAYIWFQIFHQMMLPRKKNILGNLEHTILLHLTPLHYTKLMVQNKIKRIDKWNRKFSIRSASFSHWSRYLQYSDYSVCIKFVTVFASLNSEHILFITPKSIDCHVCCVRCLIFMRACGTIRDQ